MSNNTSPHIEEVILCLKHAAEAFRLAEKYYHKFSYFAERAEEMHDRIMAHGIAQPLPATGTIGGVA